MIAYTLRCREPPESGSYSGAEPGEFRALDYLKVPSLALTIFTPRPLSIRLCPKGVVKESNVLGA